MTVTIGRRELLAALGSAAAAWPLAARAQAPPKVPTIAWIGTSPQLNASFIENFLRGMRELGYAEGRNFDMLYRFTDGYQERLPALTEEVIRLKPDVILAAAVIYAVAARKGHVDNSDRHAGARRCRSFGLDSKRSTTGGQRHGHRALCSGTAREADRVCPRNRARREQSGTSYQSEGPQGSRPGAGARGFGANREN